MGSEDRKKTTKNKQKQTKRKEIQTMICFATQAAYTYAREPLYARTGWRHTIRLATYNIVTEKKSSGVERNLREPKVLGCMCNTTKRAPGTVLFFCFQNRNNRTEIQSSLPAMRVAVLTRHDKQAPLPIRQVRFATI